MCLLRQGHRSHVRSPRERLHTEVKKRGDAGGIGPTSGLIAGRPPVDEMVTDTCAGATDSSASPIFDNMTHNQLDAIDDSASSGFGYKMDTPLVTQCLTESPTDDSVITKYVDTVGAASGGLAKQMAFGFSTDYSALCHVLNDPDPRFWLHPCLTLSHPVCAISGEMHFTPLSDSMSKIYEAVWASGRPNFMHVRAPLPSQLNIPAWRLYLRDYWDQLLPDCLEFGWPIGYVTSTWPKSTVRNHSSSLAYPSSVTQFLTREINHGAILGPFDAPPFLPCHTSPLMTAPKRHSETRRVNSRPFVALW